MYYIGFDIGGTKCAVSLGKWDQHNIEILKREETPTKANPYETLNDLASFVKEWMQNYPVRKAGISCGGPLNSQTGTILSTPNLSEQWHGFEIVSYVKQHFSLDAKLENDANACAVAEWKFGAGRGTSNMVFMTFGTGLGAGLILDGRLYSGTNGNAGEIGHVRLEPDGPVGFNKAGSAEGFCSGGGIQALARIRSKEKGIVDCMGLTTKEIFQKAENGDGFCLAVIQESAEKFANVLSILVDLLNPEAIIAGGVFMRNYDFFMSVMEPILKKEALSDALDVCKILPAELCENIGDYAALSLAVMED